jgi:integrative and conjugative element protein (TIGR02256 family)
MSVIQLRRSALATITAEAPASGDGRETGGILLGTDDGERVDVRHAGGPGPGADRSATGFRRDLIHAQQAALDAWATDGSVWVGEWHTHPRSPVCPSDTDLATYHRFLDDPTLGFQRLCAIIVAPAAPPDWDRLVLGAWLITRSGLDPAKIVVAEGRA